MAEEIEKLIQCKKCPKIIGCEIEGRDSEWRCDTCSVHPPGSCYPLKKYNNKKKSEELCGDCRKIEKAKKP